MTQLHGRWLSIQAGKMFLEDWEKHNADRANATSSKDITTSGDSKGRKKARTD
jgi:hypothetical protein